MENGFLASLSPRGQLTLPRQIRRKLNLEKGGTVLVEPSKKGVYLRPVTIRPADQDFDEREWQVLMKLAGEKQGPPRKTMKGFLKSLKSRS